MSDFVTDIKHILWLIRLQRAQYPDAPVDLAALDRSLNRLLRMEAPRPGVPTPSDSLQVEPSGAVSPLRILKVGG